MLRVISQGLSQFLTVNIGESSIHSAWPEKLLLANGNRCRVSYPVKVLGVPGQECSALTGASVCLRLLSFQASCGTHGVSFENTHTHT